MGALLNIRYITDIFFCFFNNQNNADGVPSMYKEDSCILFHTNAVYNLLLGYSLIRIDV